MNSEDIKSTVNKDGLCLSYLFLAFSIVVSAWFAYWLYEDTDIEKFLYFTSESKRLTFYEQYEEDLQLRRDILNDIYDDEIDIIWLPFVQDLPEGYTKFEMYLGLLGGDPEREETYAEIATVIDSFSEEFPSEDKIRYLAALMAIKGVDNELLEKYGLVNIPD
jgi:hypothetical protein